MSRYCNFYADPKFFVVVLWFLASSPDLAAGGGPETTLVVVNARSPLSLQVANEYSRLRDIPDTHLVWLDSVPTNDRITVKEFREQIWMPIKAFIQTQELEQEIDIIAYSADFPYAVNVSSDIKAAKLPKSRYRGNIASLTGLTYFARRVEKGDTGYLGLNHYFRDFSGPNNKGRIGLRAAGSKLEPKETKRLRKEANIAIGNKDFAAASDVYRRILNSQPEVAENWFDLSRSLAAEGKAEEAIEALGNAVDRGWAQILKTRKDRHLSALEQSPAFRSLIDRMEFAYGPFQLARGFKASYVWSNTALTAFESKDDLDRYYLSTLLAYTGVRGNSLPEIRSYLTSSVASDGTHPDGTVYLMDNPDVRSLTRQPMYPATVRELRKRGRKAEILTRRVDGQDGKAPMKKDDVIGAVLGTRSYQWGKTESRLLPGAIAESLTSYGGDFNRYSQTKLTELLRHGAAGSSGAVAEPYAFQEKFPVPMLHAYYADGCSLAESFYQSVLAPYQLIVVGDPLARPFARFATVSLKAPSTAVPWSGRVTIEAEVEAASDRSIGQVELWVDGQLTIQGEPGQGLVWDTRTVTDGYHEIRLVAVEKDPIETRSYFKTDIRVINNEYLLETENRSPVVRYGESVNLVGRAPGADRVAIFQGYRKLEVADVHQGIWRATIPSDRLGIGHTRLFARADYGEHSSVRGDPMDIRIIEPEYMAPTRLDKPVDGGILVRGKDTEGKELTFSVSRLDGKLRPPKDEARKLGSGPLNLEGYFRVRESGFYQLAASGNGSLSISVDGRAQLHSAREQDRREQFIPLWLEAGWHSLHMELDAQTRRNLKAVLAGETPGKILAEPNLAN